ncbi:MAG: lipase [Lachnospiraceae bacterium]|nr:lipase [Lachnospiraceae bacterium]
MRIGITDSSVKYIGRSVLFNDTLLLSLSGSGIEFEYTGKGLTVTFIGGEAARTPDNEENYARIGIYENGIRTRDFALNTGEMSVRIAESSETKTSVIRIIKLSECAMSIMGVRPLEISDGESVKPTSAKELKVEFIGDSITCGYGVDDPNPLHDFKTSTEDVTKGFAYKTASDLDIDYSMFSISGYGIISGYTDNPEIRHDEQLIPTFYRSMGLSYDRMEGIPATQDIPWDFSKYVPDLVVLNLGTNDDSYCGDDKERQAEFALLYIDFLKTIRRLNEKAYIVCAFGLMGTRLFTVICSAVDNYIEETGDTRISTVRLPEQDASVGYGANYHPLESEHRKAADTLVPVLKELFNL